ncbi:MAG: hypothetical protein IJJ55_06560, partial [Clostridia bacterium]|nr:hypothetical protein [Clostridia bacterium]
MKKKTALLLRDIACPCIFSVLVVTLSYMGFYRLGFGSDTILHFRFPLANIVAKFIYGRYLEYVVEYALYLLGIIVPVHYRLFFGFFLLATGARAFLVQEVVLPWYRKKHPDASQVETYFIRFVICLPFASTLFGEFMYFPECFLYSTGFFFMAIALHCLAKKQYVRTAVFLIAACLIYQTNVILFAIYGTLLLVLEADLV